MLFLLLAAIYTGTATTGSSVNSDINVGTTLFYNKDVSAECWSPIELAKLRARELFEDIVPPHATPDKISSRYVKETIKYFRRSLREAHKIKDPDTRVVLSETLADTFGAHLRHTILPAVRFAYYAGYVPYRDVRHIHDLFNELKSFLNTQGLGWRLPDKLPKWSNLTVAKVLIGHGRLLDPCACLVTKRDVNSCIHLPSPRLDDDYEPSALAVPFKSGGFVSLTSPASENILLKYYTTAARCILHSSPTKCRHLDFVNFNNELWHWMKSDVAPHLMDEKVYTAYGGVLRIAAAVQNYGRGLTRRNLFDNVQMPLDLWHPWRFLSQSYVYVNADWTPVIYVGMVTVAALTICLLQICYNYMFGDDSGCRCKGVSKMKTNLITQKSDQSCNIPFLPIYPQKQSVYMTETNAKKSTAKTKSGSIKSTRTQKVYDFNDNTEKMMAVIVSNKEDDDSVTDSKQESEEFVQEPKYYTRRSKSPPKLETPIAQMKINRTPSTVVRANMQEYSTSNLSLSEATFVDQQATESTWSGTSSNSVHSLTSVSSKSLRSQRSKSSHDLARARRIISRYSASGTEPDLQSFSTPP